MDNSQRRLLGRVDWDFIGSHADVNPGLHWYPGNFVPELPGALIDILSEDNECIFDPFGGVGTTAVAAITRGRTAVCCDGNPVAVLTSYVTACLIMLRRRYPLLLEGLFDELSAMATGLAASARSFPFASATQGVDLELAGLTGRPLEVSDIFVGAPVTAELQGWYSERTYSELLGLLSRITTDSNSTLGVLTGAVMVSSIARALSSQTRSWGHIADRVLPKEMTYKNPSVAAEAWLKRVRRRVYLIGDSVKLSEEIPVLTVTRNDWSNPDSAPVLPKASLMITSPPYAGAIDYTLAQRLSLNLFGYDAPSISALTKMEMGARRKRTDKHHVKNWAEALSAATQRQLKYLEPSATAVFVMPHKDSGREIGEESLKELMDAEGWNLEFEVDRSIRQIKARQSWTSIKRETILIFGR